MHPLEELQSIDNEDGHLCLVLKEVNRSGAPVLVQAEYAGVFIEDPLNGPGFDFLIPEDTLAPLVVHEFIELTKTGNKGDQVINLTGKAIQAINELRRSA